MCEIKRRFPSLVLKLRSAWKDLGNFFWPVNGLLTDHKPLQRVARSPCPCRTVGLERVFCQCLSKSARHFPSMHTPHFCFVSYTPLPPCSVVRFWFFAASHNKFTPALR